MKFDEYTTKTEPEQEKVFSKARREGFRVVRSNHTTLLLDLDGPEALEVYESRKAFFFESFPGREVARWASKSKGWHVVISLDTGYGFGLRSAFQAGLGSDGKRELHNVTHWLRAMEEDVGAPENYHPHTLFQPANAEIQWTLPADFKAVVYD
jgi:hypothetical protein